MISAIISFLASILKGLLVFEKLSERAERLANEYKKKELNKRLDKNAAKRRKLTAQIDANLDDEEKIKELFVKLHSGDP